ncbi:DgyrCDS3069 [Dimorphilus gyrociliatus]|uniref:DgyrCDS3069 n=1 Tax=Dimorphilus gyrociliatus TaxID=2664684 RepID=A0A7I8VCH4_9ANNE|nr:DgyrCDS3069 [Dimorphilus gyrociliatus]
MPINYQETQQPFEEIYTKEHLEDVMLILDGKGARSPTFLLFKTEYCEDVVEEHMISSYYLPPPQYVSFFIHDHIKCNEFIWYKLFKSLPETFGIFDYPSVAFIKKGENWSDAKIWNIGNEEEFIPWAWSQLKMNILVENETKRKFDVSFLLDSKSDKLRKNYYPIPFSLEPHEKKNVSMYYFDRLIVNSFGNFYSAYNIENDNKITLQQEEVHDLRFWLQVQDLHDVSNGRIRQIENWANAKRSLLNLKQPRVVQNYTKDGFYKLKIPEEIFNKILTFYNDNIEYRFTEKDPKDSLINQQNYKTTLVWLGDEIRYEVASYLLPMLSEWCNCELDMTALYGIREYYKGAVLRYHVDRIETHVISTILQIHKDLDGQEDWPLTVIDYEGNQKNVSLSPGEMLFYESTRLIHARPYPFQGKIFANAFLHYKPKTDWTYYIQEDYSPEAFINTEQWSVPLYPLDHESLPPTTNRKHLLKSLETPYSNLDKNMKTVKDEF